MSYRRVKTLMLGLVVFFLPKQIALNVYGAAQNGVAVQLQPLELVVGN